VALPTGFGAEAAYPAICAQMNAVFDVRTLVQYLAWLPNKLVRSGDVYLALCPLHNEQVFRTLNLNPRNNTYQCTHGGCVGNSPADFLDLIVRTQGKPLGLVTQELVDHFGPDYFRLSDRQLQVIRRMAALALGDESAADPCP
jgi:hypothetical protein